MGQSGKQPLTSWGKVAIVGAGGVAGALARYGLSLTVDYEWSFVVTFVVNLTGSFALAFILVYLTLRFRLSENIRLLLTTGFLGAYTTFSAYLLDFINLWRDKHPLIAGLYLVGSLAGGLFCAWLGLVLGERLNSNSRQ